jgi:transcriptional regulator with XRE-family HTH domain
MKWRAPRHLQAWKPATTTFGAELRRLREARRLSQADLAARAGCGHHSISRIESGEREASRHMLDRLSRGLALTPAEDRRLRLVYVGLDDGD